jgi:hypothetical protein
VRQYILNIIVWRSVVECLYYVDVRKGLFMNGFKVVVSFFLAVFSTAVMSYISMATPIGPWIAPTLVLCGMLVLLPFYEGKLYRLTLVYVVVSGSIGGILATAFGFSFPTLYFLDPVLFDSWMAQPILFAGFVSGLAVVACWYGMWMANVLDAHFVDQERLPFPVAQMIYKMISSYNQVRKAYELVIGFIGTTIFCMLQEGLYYIPRIVPKLITLCRSYTFLCVRMPAIELELWPMLWAIGFVTGRMIVVPLAVGACSKIGVIQPMQELLFSSVSPAEFLLAFCSGMVLFGALQAFAPHTMLVHFRNAGATVGLSRIRLLFSRTDKALLLEGSIVLASISLFLFYINCGLLLQLYLIVSTFVCSYQIIGIAGEIGLAQLGRFATFVLMPALLFFKPNAVQIAVISTFVEAAAGVAVDIVCGRKVVQLAGGSQRIARRYQYFGMAVSCIVLGMLLWLLINRFKLGSPELFAQRSQARKLLVDVRQVNYLILAIGAAFGFLLKKVKMNPMLVLGGLLMPMNVSLGLVMGGLSSLAVHNKEEWYPFWSGVFAANSIWMLIQALV